ncbi:hypothetical protein [Priestia megaterium]
MNPELKERLAELQKTIKNTGNRYEIDLLNHVAKEVCDLPLNRYTYIKLDRMAEMIKTITSIYEPKRKRDIKNINNVLEIIRLYRELFYDKFAKEEEEIEQAKERRAAFKVV